MSIFSDILGFNDAGRAAKSVSDANIAAEHGVLGAVGGGQNAIQGAIDRGSSGVNGALDGANAGVNGALAGANTNVNAAGANVTSAAGAANTNLQGILGGINNNVSSSIQSGQQGNEALQKYAASNPQFSFNYQDYANDPAFKFQLEQGTNAITNQAAASGLSQGGGTLAALTQYGQGLAATHYDDAFQRAKSQFQTNQNTTLANLSTLINSGAQGNAIASQAGQNIGALQSGNTTGAAGTNANLQAYLGGLNTTGQQGLGSLNTGAQLGLGQQGIAGADAIAGLGLQGSKLAGDYAIGAGNAHASGIIGQGAALGKGITDLAGLFSPMVGSIPLGGGNATTLAGLFG